MQQMGSEYSGLSATILGGFLGSVVVEASVLAVKTLACSLLMVTSSARGVNPLASLDKEVSQRFPFEELYAVMKPGPENVDGSETEDDDDEDEGEEPDDEEEEDEGEEGGEANGDEEGDPEDEPDANDGGNEDEDDDDENDDDEEDVEDEDEEEEEDEDEPEPPSKKRK